MRRLKQTLLAGGVVYPAGTREDAIDVAVQRDDVWDDVDIDFPAAVSDDDGDVHPVTAELREFVEYLAEEHLADKDTPLAELVSRAVDVYGFDFGDDEPSGSDDTTVEGGEGSEEGAVPPASEPVDYSGQDAADLKTEVEKRGLEVEGSGANGRVVKDDMVKALAADDAAKA